MQRLTLRFAVGGNPASQFELEQAEYYSFEQAIAELRLLAIERDGAGRQKARARVRAAGVMKAILCQNAVDGNEYDVTVEDVSETGVQFTTELQVEPRSVPLTMRAEGERVRIVATAVNVSQGAYGPVHRRRRITEVPEADLLAIRRLAARHQAE